MIETIIVFCVGLTVWLGLHNIGIPQALSRLAYRWVARAGESPAELSHVEMRFPVTALRHLKVIEVAIILCVDSAILTAILLCLPTGGL
ncbi:hypothetical protein EV193_112120 [Herbihabitans rhizosphaerae]|uniref:Uncharacterized protein n=1 Tax=Herbihabitans rhizosphaerae TaxID=1872711 RepID=A0A4Q7KG09_9PSEU|nr:hypothetical protein [Herbihabitans rhizosphaerae]RZS32486.1 hypothetical protein EV193_112120 [Herbihabitans rhizosphaerae]